MLFSDADHSSQIQSLKKYQRPRERLVALGAHNLTNQELLAIILTKGSRQQSVLQLAATLKQAYSLNQLSQLTPAALVRIKGIGLAQATKLLACFEIGRRLLQPSLIKLNSPLVVVQAVQEIRHQKQEHALVLYLNGRQELIEKKVIAIGGLNFNLIEAREVFAPALTLPAASLILVHNHPSGDAQPSANDLKVTKKLCQAGQLLGIEMIDHVIVSHHGYFSFKEKNLINLHQLF